MRFKALRFYSGDAKPEAVKAWTLDGFRDFADVQAGFMATLAE